MKLVHRSDGTQLLLTERGATHGDFSTQARLSQELKSFIHKGLNWDTLSCVQKEALEMIAHKISRIVSGDPNHVDHWEDIQGYACLVSNRLRSAV